MFVCAQTTSIKEKHKNKTTVGFRTGSGVLFSTTPLHNKQGKLNYSINNSLVFSKPLSPHLKAEALLNFSILQNPCCIDKIFGNKPVEYLKSGKLLLPVTLQYYPIKRQNKLQPYLGAGMQYNFNPYTNTQASDDAANAHPNNPGAAGTKYISIIFTQGITYEVSTRIQVTQSFHFIPEANKTIGIDIGIGYTIP